MVWLQFHGLDIDMALVWESSKEILEDLQLVSTEVGSARNDMSCVGSEHSQTKSELRTSVSSSSSLLLMSTSPVTNDRQDEKVFMQFDLLTTDL